MATRNNSLYHRLPIFRILADFVRIVLEAQFERCEEVADGALRVEVPRARKSPSYLGFAKGRNV